MRCRELSAKLYQCGQFVMNQGQGLFNRLELVQNQVWEAQAPVMANGNITLSNQLMDIHQQLRDCARLQNNIQVIKVQEIPKDDMVPEMVIQRREPERNSQQGTNNNTECMEEKPNILESINEDPGDLE